MRDFEVEYEEIFDGPHIFLDHFFENMIHEYHINDDVECLKEDLMQETAAVVWKKKGNPRYLKYGMKHFIIMQATDVWNSYLRKRKRQVTTFALEDDDKVSRSLSGCHQTVSRQEQVLTELQEAFSGEDHNQSWQIISLVAEGYNSKEISLRLNKTPGAVRAQLSRFRIELKQYSSLYL
jgi:DNA-directed RNA polymerase specialized sigma24 family protein